MVSGLPDFSKYVVLKGSEVTLDVDVVGSVTLDVNVVGSVVLDVNIKSQAVTLNVNIESQSVTLDVKITGSDVTLNVNVTNASIKVDIGSPLDASGNVKTAIVDSVQIDVNIAASSVTLDVNIASQAVTLDVNIASSGVTLDVNIKSQAVTLDVNIAAQDVTLNVSVQGTASVSIDNATVVMDVKSRCEGRNLITLQPTMTSVEFLSQKGRAVWFSHVDPPFILRGVKIYAKNTGTSDQTVTLGFIPMLGAPPILTCDITVPAGFEGWTSTKWVNVQWMYENLIVVVLDIGSDVQLGFDSSANDYAINISPGTWKPSVIGTNLWVQVLIASHSGKIAVSGTVNTIQIPNRAVSSVSSAIYNIPDEETRTLLEVEGCGRVEWLNLWTDWYDMYFDIYVDGERICLMPGYPNVSMRIGIYKPHYGDTGLGNRVVVTKYDTSADEYAVEITIPLEFKKRFKVTAKNRAGTTKQAAAAAVLNMLS